MVEYFKLLFGKKRVSKSFIDIFLLKRVSSTSEMLLKTLQNFIIKLIEIY